jgi:hypothetical protein
MYDYHVFVPHVHFNLNIFAGVQYIMGCYFDLNQFLLYQKMCAYLAYAVSISSVHT